jgi:6-pyruvoyltetrahydropterin/6-carboxytetrahydropterin synthase
MAATRPLVRLTRTARFSAAHRYHRADWPEQRNRAAFGANADIHGHNYRVEVSVRGPVDPETGMCVDLARVDQILEAEVVARLGWRDLSHGVEGLAGLPTTENLAVHVWARVQAALRSMGVEATLERVRVYESPELYAEYDGS